MGSGKEEEIQKLDKNLKSAFTRQYNKTQKKFASTAKGKKGAGQASRVAEDDVGFMMEENIEDNKVEEEEVDEEVERKAIEKEFKVTKKAPAKKAKEPKPKKQKK